MSVSAGVSRKSLDENINETSTNGVDSAVVDSNVVDASLAASCLLLRDSVTPAPTELQPPQRGTDIVSEFRAFWGRFRSGSPHRMLNDLELISAVIEDCKASLRSGIPELPTLEDKYQKYPPESDLDPYDWLAEHWGQWLQHFSSKLDRDHLFLDQLGKLDPDLKRALYAKRRSILSRTGCKVSEIIPKKSVRLDFELAEVDQESLREAVRLYVAPRSRKAREK